AVIEVRDIDESAIRRDGDADRVGADCDRCQDGAGKTLLSLPGINNCDSVGGGFRHVCKVPVWAYGDPVWASPNVERPKTPTKEPPVVEDYLLVQPKVRNEHEVSVRGDRHTLWPCEIRLEARGEELPGVGKDFDCVGVAGRHIQRASVGT